MSENLGWMDFTSDDIYIYVLYFHLLLLLLLFVKIMPDDIKFVGGPMMVAFYRTILLSAPRSVFYLVEIIGRWPCVRNATTMFSGVLRGKRVYEGAEVNQMGRGANV
jgi:hypothetical protein